MSSHFIIALYAAGHLAGLRENTCLFSGTSVGGESGTFPLFLGLLYAGSYFAFVLGVPVLLFASLLFALSLKLADRVFPPPETGERPDGPTATRDP